MRKVLKDTKSLLLENMVKLNPDFQLREEDEKWIQNAVNPEHKGYCTPMSKPTCTPRRKALAMRFKKGIDEVLNIEDYDESNPEYIKRYKERVYKLKSFMDDLLNQGEFEVLDTLYRLLIDRKSKAVTVGQPALTEDNSSQYKQKIELLKNKIDFLYNNNHYDLIDKINAVIGNILNDEPEFD